MSHHTTPSEGELYMCQERNQKEKFKFLEFNENENVTSQNIYNTEKLIVLCAYIRNYEPCQSKYLIALVDIHTTQVAKNVFPYYGLPL